jgi:hypothetical protein
VNGISRPQETLIDYPGRFCSSGLKCVFGLTHGSRYGKYLLKDEAGGNGIVSAGNEGAPSGAETSRGGAIELSSDELA